jgi:hypothetical protein
LALGALAPSDAASVCGLAHDASRAAAVVESLVGDGLVARHADGSLALPC